MQGWDFEYSEAYQLTEPNEKTAQFSEYEKPYEVYDNRYLIYRMNMQNEIRLKDLILLIQKKYVTLSDRIIIEICRQLLYILLENQEILPNPKHLILQKPPNEKGLELGYNSECLLQIKYLAMAYDILNMNDKSISEKDEILSILDTLLERVGHTHEMRANFYKIISILQNMEPESKWKEIQRCQELLFEQSDKQNKDQFYNIDQNQKKKNDLLNGAILYLLQKQGSQLDDVNFFNPIQLQQMGAIIQIEAISDIKKVLEGFEIPDQELLDEYKKTTLVNKYRDVIKDKYNKALEHIKYCLKSDFLLIHQQLSQEIKLPEDDQLFHEFTNQSGSFKDYFVQINQKLFELGVFNSVKNFEGQSIAYFYNKEIYKSSILRLLKEFFKKKISQTMNGILVEKQS